jgi:hypothetical protein
LFRTTSQLEIDYRHCSFNAGKAGDIHGGDRLPWVASEGTDNYKPLAHMVWQVHVYGHPKPDLAAWCDQHDVPLLFLHGDPSTRKPGSSAMRCICCGRIPTLASLTARARSRPLSATWTHAQCGSGRPKGRNKRKVPAQRSLRPFDREWEPPSICGLRARSGGPRCGNRAALRQSGRVEQRSTAILFLGRLKRATAAVSKRRVGKAEWVKGSKRDLRPPESHWPWQQMPGPTMTNGLPEGRGEGRFWPTARKYEPETVVCPLRDVAGEIAWGNSSWRRLGTAPGGMCVVGLRLARESHLLPAVPAGVPSRASRGLWRRVGPEFPTLRRVRAGRRCMGGALAPSGGPSTTTARSGLSCLAK